jgi:hypothetical protein
MNRLSGRGEGEETMRPEVARLRNALLVAASALFAVTASAQAPASVAITGAVKKVGQYPLEEAATIADLLLKAGGVNEASLTRSGEPIHASVFRMIDGKPVGCTARPETGLKAGDVVQVDDLRIPKGRAACP